jgi:hypothetical protein
MNQMDMKLKSAVIAFGATVILASTTPAQSRIESVYTTLSGSGCRTIEIDEESGSSVQSCPGVGGYKLLVLEGDLRQSIDVVNPQGQKFELNFWHVITGGFSSVGSKAEWRVLRKGGKLVPIALIVRVNANEDPENPDRTNSYLSVTKISADTACVTHKIKAGTRANKLARKAAAHAATAPCLKEITP